MSNTPTLGRREKLNSSVRSALNEQLMKIQVKHTAELELLDDIRNFLKQRAQIEKEYSQNMQKLVHQYQSKHDVKTPPPIPNFDRLENRGVMEMWKGLLDKTEELGRRRGTVGDLLAGSINDDLKRLKRSKEQNYKRQSDILQLMISEVLDSVRELTTAKKLYNERWKMCEEVRQKFNDGEDRLRNCHFKMFESKAALERTQKKNAEKLKLAQKQLVVQRNDYLLTLAEVNTHLNRHSETDLTEALKIIDGELYDCIRNTYILYAQIEIDGANAVRAEFEDLREQASLVNREYVLECFIKDNPILRDKISYTFEPSGDDKVTTLSREHEAELYLNKEARKWSQQLTKLHQKITEKNKAIRGLQSVTKAYHINPEFGTNDAVAEALFSLHQIQEEIRQIEVTTTKANARLDLLRDSGIDVSKWLQQAAHTEGEYTPGEHRVTDKTASPDLVDLTTSLHPTAASVSSLSIKGADSDTASLRSDAISLNSYQSEHTYPTTCKALYSYQAQRSDELDITTDEELDIMEWDDGDGWCKGRNKTGSEGFFPQSYVQPLTNSCLTIDSSSSSPPHSDYITTSATTSGISGISGGTSHGIGSGPSLSINDTSITNNEVMLRALFDYSAQEDEELSFPEGAIIKLLKTDDNGIDDGWWEGQYEGKVGVFPSVVVEVLSGDINQELTPVGSEVFSLPSNNPTTSSPTSPVPPPPSYPAPEISANDLSILPLRHHLTHNLSSGSTPSFFTQLNPGAGRPLGDSMSANTSPQIKRSSGVISQKNNPLSSSSYEIQDSFEDTLQDTKGRWSSFDDLEDSYV